MTAPGTDDEVVQCSAKGCRAAAVHVLVWNNPKLHTPDREKTWVACDRHRSSLAEHLDVRGFLRRVEPLVPESQTAAAGSQIGGSQVGGPQVGGSGAVEAGATAEGGSARGSAEAGADFVCSACGARFPAGQDFCPVCAGTRTGSCGSRD